MSSDGYFYIVIIKCTSCKLGYVIILIVYITQHYKDQLLIKSIINNLKCGYIKKQFKNVINFKTTKTIPLFN